MRPMVGDPTSTAANSPFGSIEHSGCGREHSSMGTHEFANKELVRVASIDSPSQTSPPATLYQHTPQTTGSICTC